MSHNVALDSSKKEVVWFGALPKVARLMNVWLCELDTEVLQKSEIEYVEKGETCVRQKRHRLQISQQHTLTL